MSCDYIFHPDSSNSEGDIEDQENVLTISQVQPRPRPNLDPKVKQMDQEFEQTNSQIQPQRTCIASEADREFNDQANSQVRTDDNQNVEENQNVAIPEPIVAKIIEIIHLQFDDKIAPYETKLAIVEEHIKRLNNCITSLQTAANNKEDNIFSRWHCIFGCSMIGFFAMAPAILFLARKI
jgi:hypothetical protein